MTCHCWKCTQELKSTREEFCPACGVVSPYDGKQRFERIRGKLRQVKRWEKIFDVFGQAGFMLTIPVTVCGLWFWIRSPFVLDYGQSIQMGLFLLGLAFILFFSSMFLLTTGDEKRKRQQEIYEKAEADLEKIHPAFYDENILLRPTDAPSSETHLRPAQTTPTDPEQLVRVADARGTDEAS